MRKSERDSESERASARARERERERKNECEGEQGRVRGINKERGAQVGPQAAEPGAEATDVLRMTEEDDPWRDAELDSVFAFLGRG